MLLNWRKRLLQNQMSFKRNGMWRRIEIKNFRSIDSAAITLAPFTVVVGPNGSGKSNFVDAFVLVRDVAADASSAVSSRGGLAGVRRWKKNRPTDVTLDLRVARTREELDTQFARHFFKLHSGKEGSWSFSQEVIEARDGGKMSVLNGRARK